ncbi:hypothetical protein ACWDRR_00790 [Kitasatospora sp. NPDC003701]
MATEMATNARGYMDGVTYAARVEATMRLAQFLYEGAPLAMRSGCSANCSGPCCSP